MYKTALYPGSFDPVTRGHVDIIKRASKMYDRVIIGIFKNSIKTKAWFTDEEKSEMINEILEKENINAEIKIFGGLLVDFIKNEKVDVLVRGLRAVSDFEYELQMAQTNRVIAPDIDTIFLTTNLKYSYLSSSIVKEIAGYQGDISEFLHPAIAEKVRERLANK